MTYRGWESFTPKGGPPERPSRSKYGAVKTTRDGITFDSKKEADRWTVLKARQHAKEISGLSRQVPFELSVLPRDPVLATTVGFQRIGTYVADFCYIEDGARVVEDVKGRQTDMYRWKKKHLLAEYGIVIKET
jgi:hypothetical protein